MDQSMKRQLRRLKQWLVNQGAALWCDLTSHRWDVMADPVRCSRCGRTFS